MDQNCYTPTGLIHSPYRDPAGMPIQAVAAKGVAGSIPTCSERTLLAVRNTMAALHVGVTALRAVAEANFIDVALRETFANRQPTGLWQKGYVDKRLVGPRLFCSGPAIRMTGEHESTARIDTVFGTEFIEADGPDEMRKAARQPAQS